MSRQNGRVVVVVGGKVVVVVVVVVRGWVVDVVDDAVGNVIIVVDSGAVVVVESEGPVVVGGPERVEPVIDGSVVLVLEGLVDTGGVPVPAGGVVCVVPDWRTRADVGNFPSPFPTGDCALFSRRRVVTFLGEFDESPLEPTAGALRPGAEALK
ncbi:MAG TPA: hypothetical protein VKR27_01210 [Acidimicrobiales bacterium]|nr:hypothetical protein [Acidimicrobiales bacterium]